MAGNKCKYCGNNPVPHFLHWYFESLNILVGPIRVAMLHNPLAGALSAVAGRFSIGLRIVDCLRAAGIITYQNSPEKCLVARARVLWDEAVRRGIVMRELLIFGKPFDYYVAEQGAGSGGRRILFSGLPRPSAYDDTALDTMDDKAYLKQVLFAAGLPVPAGAAVTSRAGALSVFRSVSKPVIVKPRSGSRGRHSITNIYTEDELVRAFSIAKQLCFWVVVEEHVPGPVYRATVIDYVTRGVLRGDSPQVSGDGIHTVAQLVAAKNGAPHPGVKDIILDEKSRDFLSRQGLDESSVPARGRQVELSEKIGVSYGGSSSEDLSVCHDDNKLLFQQAARAVGDPIIGFDFIIPDITASYKGQQCGFIEANSLPFINLHHDPLLGKPENVAAAVWDLAGFRPFSAPV